MTAKILIPAHENAISAFRLFTGANGESVFEEGTIPCDVHIKSGYFFAQSVIEAYQKSIHPAPRRQYVVTLKGKLRFTVSDGSGFFLEPGVILVAEDIEGQGHSWALIEGAEWIRLYIPFGDDEASAFVPVLPSSI